MRAAHGELQGPDERVRPTLNRVTIGRSLAVIPIVLGVIALVGWFTGQEVLKGLLLDTPMKANTALSLVLVGAGYLLIAARVPTAGASRALLTVLLGLPAVLGSLTLFEYLSGVRVGIDEMLFIDALDPDLPGRMSLGASIGLILTSGGTLAIIGRARMLPLLLGSVSCTLASLAILGHLYEASELTGLGFGTQIAIPTAAALVCLAAAVMSHPAVHGPHEILGRRSRGGDVARVLLIAAATVLPAIGVLRVLGEHAGLYGTGFGVAFMTALSGATLAMVGTWLGHWLDDADAKRRSTERDLAQLIDLSSDAICIANGEGFMEQLNPAWTTILGHGTSELRARPFLEFVHPDDTARTVAEFQRILAGNDVTAGFTNRYQHRDGSYRTIEWNSVLNRDSGRVFAIARDVSARVERERERALQAAIVETTDDAVMSFDLDARVTSWNRGAERLYGYEASEAVGSDVAILIPPDRSDEASLRRAQIRNGSPATRVETVRLHRDGRQMTVMVTTSPLRDSDGHLLGASAVTRDITELKTARDAVQAINTQLVERNNELRDFASIVSHDLRAPLRRLQMFADMAAELSDKDPEVADLMVRMQSSATRMEALVIDLLTYARLGATGIGMRRVHLGAVVGEALSDLQPAVLETCALVESGPMPTIEADPLLLRQLVTNLVGNGLKFRKPNTPPVISVNAKVVDDHGDRHVDLTVTDSGIGFEPQYAERIFGIFERIETEGYQGTGVGLAICRKVALLHNGTIDAASRPGDGATFTVHLPIQQPHELPDVA